MTAITITDLNNAKLDVDHIAAIATSTSLTTTDRLGGVKKTIAGTNADLVSKVAEVETAKNTAINTSIPSKVTEVQVASAHAVNIDIPAALALVDTAVAQTAAGQATAAKVDAESARDAATLSAQAAASSTGIYDSVTLGRDASVATEGPTSFFQVKKGGLGPDGVTTLARQTMYQRTGSGTQIALYAILPASEFDTASPLFPEMFETIDGVSEGNFLIDGDGKILAQFPDPVVVELQSAAVTRSEFETIDSGSADVVLLLDGEDKILTELATVTHVANAVANMSLPAGINGSRNSLLDRLASGMTPYGDPIGPYANTWSLRQTRMLLRKLAMGEAAQCVITLIGDSYTQGGYYAMALTKSLQTLYGNAGAGWIGLGWYGTAAGTWTDASQPVGIDGNARSDVIWLLKIIGTWTRTYNTASLNTPSLSVASSSTAGDYIRFNIPAGHSAANLFYAGDGTGVVAVSWDDGATYGANIALDNVGAASVALAGTPAGNATARIKVVSGNVSLAGIDLQSATSGVRVHKLGASGGTAAQRAGVTAASWNAQMAVLGGHLHVVMMGTNDQGASASTATFATSISTICTNAKTALPGTDVLVTMPPENQRTTNATGMPLYAKAAREYAVPNDAAFLDLQYFFGSPANFAAAYAYANAQRPWYASDLIHPDPNTGGRVIVDALHRLITQL